MLKRTSETQIPSLRLCDHYFAAAGDPTCEGNKRRVELDTRRNEAKRRQVEGEVSFQHSQQLQRFGARRCENGVSRSEMDSVTSPRQRVLELEVLDMRLALERSQTDVVILRQTIVELRQQLDEVVERERRSLEEVRKLLSERLAAEARIEDMQVEARYRLDKMASLEARVSVLRETLDRVCGTAGDDASEVQDWRANVVVEKADSEQEKRKAPADVVVDSEGHPVKVLHLRRRPGDVPSSASTVGESVRDGVDVFRACDLERAQAVSQLERFKKATRKYVQEFREGIFALLGWSVEMKQVGKHMQWHLSSRYVEGAALVFQARPAKQSGAAEFEFAWSPWGEQLQSDRGAMFYLEEHRSFPGFLAQVTSDLVSQKTLTS
eukprot:TRINITY_DN67224_c0_g1_i1.p1 TRINITY_DN67224_c0_g1~~TRINITY_DN67224_c0_g1_i1.p1  ORF type:complete len:380 (-),score=59.81 TRINITY_DN67224_c0_g1_i1:495-1634(-)